LQALACSRSSHSRGCGLLPDVVDETANLNAEGSTSSRTTRCSTEIIRARSSSSRRSRPRFPYGRYAQQAILEAAYANYRAGETGRGGRACDRFIRTFPNNPSVDYAYYLKGLVNFREDQGLLGFVYELDLSEREPKG
jgi:outer membrane protein assembly factor BamD